jgi:hypothetical protein
MATCFVLFIGHHQACSIKHKLSFLNLDALIWIHIVTCRLKAGILEAVLFPRQRSSEARLPHNAQQTLRTLRDDEGIVPLGQSVHYSVLKETTWARAGSNTSTLRVVEGDEKGSHESETVNYGHESHGSRTRKCLHWQGPGAIVNDRPVLSSERAPHINQHLCDSNKNLVMGALFQDRLADWPSVVTWLWLWLGVSESEWVLRVLRENSN